MAVVLVHQVVGVGDEVERMVGAVVNVWTTHADAYNRGSSNLATIYADTITVADGTDAQGSAITQAVGTTGVEVDKFGKISFWAEEDTIYYLNSAHELFPGPLKIYPAG